MTFGHANSFFPWLRWELSYKETVFKATDFKIKIACMAALVKKKIWPWFFCLLGGGGNQNCFLEAQHSRQRRDDQTPQTADRENQRICNGGRKIASTSGGM